MIKIFLTVRNRLAITMKCIESIRRHTKGPYQIYVYNNQTNYMIGEHFKYFGKLYEKGIVTQVTFNTNESTFNAFSKASACNMFGLQHEHDPKKEETTHLLMIDNDIILTPLWDENVKKAWKYITDHKLHYIKVVGQLPGGIKRKEVEYKIDNDTIGRAGVLGGSGLWCVKSNFFKDVGYLDLRQLQGQHKRHDQLYWESLKKASGGKPYIMGINKKLGIHCGRLCGSVCNTLTRLSHKNKSLDCINFADSDKKIMEKDFDTFFKEIYNNKLLISDW